MVMMMATTPSKNVSIRVLPINDCPPSQQFLYPQITQMLSNDLCNLWITFFRNS